jgi:hypothetical protein
MAGIGEAESAGNPKARNPTSTATGLWQILVGTSDDGQGYAAMENPIKNARQALKLYKERGYQPWETDAYYVSHHLATGTREAPPGMVWKGERGPELEFTSGGESVFSATQSAHLAKQAAKGVQQTPWTSILGQSFSTPPQNQPAQSGSGEVNVTIGNINISGSNAEKISGDFVKALQGKLTHEKLLLTIASGEKLG